MSIRALIADDEDLARQRLKRLLARHPDVEVVGEAADGLETASQVLALRPDILFLDINMPAVDGLGALERIHADLPHALRPAVVFTTAYEEHALRAFELEGTDYLLKPVEDETLGRALRRVRRRMAAAQPREQAAALEDSRSREGQTVATEPPDAESGETRGDDSQPGTARSGDAAAMPYLAARRGEKILKLALDRVGCIVVEDTLCFACTPEGKFRLKPSLGELEGRLPCPPWLRVSRSALVNLDWVGHLDPLFSGRYLITLRAPVSQELEVSRRRARRLRELLGW